MEFKNRFFLFNCFINLSFIKKIKIFLLNEWNILIEELNEKYFLYFIIKKEKQIIY